jgi:acetyl-CoA synthetase
VSRNTGEALGTAGFFDALIEHRDVVECAVAPSPDPLRAAVPKAFITIRSGVVPSREIALSIFQHIRKAPAPFNRIRRIEFSDLPKTISRKIRRVELRDREAENVRCGARPEFEFREEDFPDLGCYDQNGAKLAELGTDYTP